MARTSRYSAKHLFIGAASTALLSLSVVPSGGADESPQVAKSEQRFDIPAQPLSEALAEFSRQSKSNVVAPSVLTSGRMSAPVAGEMTPETALSQLMRNTGLRIRPRAQGGFVVAQAVASGPKPERTQFAQTATDKPEAISTPGESRASGNEDEILRQEKVTVTGTLIRGFAPESSPLDIYNRDDILNSGAGSTEQFIRQLPQNFGGGSNEYTFAGLPTDSNSQQNSSFGAGANLRGLGSGGTLVLLNGNRLAPTSTIGDFVDLSIIPISALDRVDVLTDGASSIYGGDAVAGVLNFVLRDDFDGAETALRYGAVTDGDYSEFRFSQALGRSWGSGNLLATYEYSKRDRLRLSDRPDLAPPAVTATDETTMERISLLPRQERHGVVLSGGQELGPVTKASFSGLYTERNAFNSTVVSGGDTNSSDVKTAGLALNAGVLHEFGPDWSASVDLNYSQMRNEQRTATTTNANAASVEFDSDVWSGDLRVSGKLLEIVGGTIRAAAGAHIRREDFITETGAAGKVREGERDVTSVFGEILLPVVGEENPLPGIERLELNVSGRWDDYSDFGTTSNPKIGALWVPIEGLKIRGSYSTSFSPPPLGQVGNLRRSAAAYPYALILQTLGLSPQDPALQAVDYIEIYGTAPDLEPQTSTSYTSGFDFEKENGPHSWQVRATYYDIDFKNRLGTAPVPNGLNPAVAPYLAYDDPGSFPQGTVLFFPTPEEVADIVGSLTEPVRYRFGATQDNIGVVNRVYLIRNLATVETRGVDLRIDYRRETEIGALFAGLNGNYIADYTQQAASSTPGVETLNTLYNPVDLTVRGKIGFEAGGLSTTAFINFTDDYSVDSTQSSRAISSWTTVDVVTTWRPRDGAGSFLNGLTLNLSVTNIFDIAPPATPTNSIFRIPGYDPANATPLGRFIGIEVRKEF